jgi:hypothetical protein
MFSKKKFAEFEDVLPLFKFRNCRRKSILQEDSFEEIDSEICKKYLPLLRNIDFRRKFLVLKYISEYLLRNISDLNKISFSFSFRYKDSRKEYFYDKIPFFLLLEKIDEFSVSGYNLRQLHLPVSSKIGTAKFLLTKLPNSLILDVFHLEISGKKEERILLPRFACPNLSSLKISFVWRDFFLPFPLRIRPKLSFLKMKKVKIGKYPLLEISKEFDLSELKTLKISSCKKISLFLKKEIPNLQFLSLSSINVDFVPKWMNNCFPKNGGKLQRLKMKEVEFEEDCGPNLTYLLSVKTRSICWHNIDIFDDTQLFESEEK